MFLLCFLILIVTVSATDAIGQRQDAQVGIPYIVSQPCASCSYINISILTKDGIVLENTPMINNGSTWVYTFTPNDSLRHDVNGVGDKDGVDDSFAFWFDATLSGQQTNSTIILSDLVLLFFVMVIIFLIYYNSKKTDYKAWEKQITDKHTNIGKTLLSGFIYGLFKNTFIWFYFLGWILILILKDIIYRFNSAEIYEYFTLIATIYSLGLFLVVVFMIGWFYNYMKETLETLSDNNWGITDGE